MIKQTIPIRHLLHRCSSSSVSVLLHHSSNIDVCNGRLEVVSYICNTLWKSLTSPIFPCSSL
jgi:hypothetical protein